MVAQQRHSSATATRPVVGSTPDDRRRRRRRRNPPLRSRAIGEATRALGWVLLISGSAVLAILYGSFLTRVVFPSKTLEKAARRASMIAMKDRRKIFRVRSMGSSSDQSDTEGGEKKPMLRLAADRPKIIPNPIDLLKFEPPDPEVDEESESDDDESKEEEEDVEEGEEDVAERDEIDNGANKTLAGPPPGVVVIGMHRSGTSLLAGLLVKGMRYQVGPKRLLIQPAADNVKGFYERLDAVLQNDQFLSNQGMSWNAGVVNYDYKKALKAYRDKEISFVEGEKALSFFNNEENEPWLQKDPRMCITLRTWLDLFNREPVALFTYRHPLEVANSLQKRENFKISHGLRLWIVYNVRAVQNSANLCRVSSSANALFASPLAELDRLADGLLDCGLPPPINEIKETLINSFIDPNLRHNKNVSDGKIMARHGDCEVRDFKTDDTGMEQEMQKELYLQAMHIYCDFENGKALKSNYEWPKSKYLSF